MGHRRMFSTPQMFENDHDQNRNHMHEGQPYMYLARANNTAGSSSMGHQLENVSVDGVHFSSHWNPIRRSNDYSSSCHNVEIPCYRSDVLGPFCDPFLHPSVAGRFSTTPMHYASSSCYERQTFDGIKGEFVDHATANGGGPYKRKNPAVPSVCEEGSTSRHYDGGSSSDLSICSDLQQDKPSTNCQHSIWDPTVMAPSYSANTLPIGGDGFMRHVRSRSALDLESNLARTLSSSNPLLHPYAGSHPIDHINLVDLSSQSSISSGEWNQVHVPPAQWRAPISEPVGLWRETNYFRVGSNTGNASVDIRGYRPDLISSRNHVQHDLHGASIPCVRGVRGSYCQRSTPTSRASLSNLLVVQFRMQDDSMHLVAESLSSRPLRSLPVIGWGNGERNGRPRTSERYHSISYEADVLERSASEALMFVDQTPLYGSTDLFGEHEDMRLDVDNMSYEELLVLGERIGYVSTGLSEDLISKCLAKTIYCSSGQIQEGKCVICLEEYNNMDEVGTLKICCHDYHVSCIKKWLSMKNACPICKTSVCG